MGICPDPGPDDSQYPDPLSEAVEGGVNAAMPVLPGETVDPGVLPGEVETVVGLVMELGAAFTGPL